MLVRIHRKRQPYGWHWWYELVDNQPPVFNTVKYAFSKKFNSGMEMLIHLDAWISGRV